MKLMQRKILTILLATALVSVAVFGFLGMGVMDGGMAHTCPFSSLVLGNCAILNSVASLAAHHFTMLQNLAGELASFDIFFLVFSLLFLCALFPTSEYPLKTLTSDARAVPRSREALPSIQKLRLLRWLAYHNKRDYLVPIRVRILAPTPILSSSR